MKARANLKPHPRARRNPANWHPADIVSAMRKAGWSLRKLSRHHGYQQETTLAVALRRPWPLGEELIAEAIGTTPAEIWPDRYAARAATRPSDRRIGRKSARRAGLQENQEMPT